MSSYSTNYAAAFLRALDIERRNTGDVTLKQLLETAMVGRVNSTRNGVQITSTSQNGKSVTFSMPPGVTAVSIAELCVDLIRLYDRSTSYLVQQDIATPDEDAVFAEMDALLVPNYEEGPGDFSGIREVQFA